MSEPHAYYFLFRARPCSDHPRFAAYGGAFINCWIIRPTQVEAEAVARKMVEEQRWSINAVEEAFFLDRSTYDDNPEGLGYYEQALLDKEVLVIHTYPIDEDPGKE